MEKRVEKGPRTEGGTFILAKAEKRGGLQLFERNTTRVEVLHLQKKGGGGRSHPFLPATGGYTKFKKRGSQRGWDRLFLKGVATHGERGGKRSFSAYRATTIGKRFRE